MSERPVRKLRSPFTEVRYDGLRRLSFLQSPVSDADAAIDAHAAPPAPRRHRRNDCRPGRRCFGSSESSNAVRPAPCGSKRLEEQGTGLRVAAGRSTTMRPLARESISLTARWLVSTS